MSLTEKHHIQLKHCVKQGSIYTPTQGVYFKLFCPKQGQCLKPSAAPLYPTLGEVLPPPPPLAGKSMAFLFQVRMSELPVFIDWLVDLFSFYLNSLPMAGDQV